ncbi:tRNA (adenosine(37)-N6)-threonylcarbamoyltransferase complex ATPase subunit type 1 TsaE [Thioclava sp. SK-1]|uniref:tRNA (adenosine(37)-N6)-threonylcarbamoyltransferase complex ATPase subunit type 1 TsaE n=1 Tax=Thioclava sp. SK-1 TaxID=1889770 RepID=UPI000824C248|nr:tRNA (adenosine(37)-N6)-threonylcarbamoyltransferase complex ATPase subunit type 1 TsaE [Thioclava sp. SK-1]OCX61579.1 tRNA (adenosine(37)-N6)-threonylcarbamoyltransferase complex ATPase subunit type 1 TsaE [Thioclava sp. SK-1]
MSFLPPHIRSLDLPDADATADLGRRLGSVLASGDVVLLDGPIGAGKTHFSRTVIQDRMAQSGQVEDVPSPTFTLVQVYETDPEIWHADLYRLHHPDDVIELGLDVAFDEAICLVEWPDRLGDLTPKTALQLAFRNSADGESRQVTISGDAEWAARLQKIGLA